MLDVNQLQSGPGSNPTQATVEPLVRFPPFRDIGCVIQPCAAAPAAESTSVAATRAEAAIRPV